MLLLRLLHFLLAWHARALTVRIEWMGIGIVGSAISIGVLPFVRIVWEPIISVMDAVTIPIEVGIVASAVSVAVLRLPVIVRHLVMIITNSVSISVLLLVRGVRECIIVIVDSIPVP